MGMIGIVKAAPVVQPSANPPKIRKISPAFDRLEGGAQVEIKGKNFTPDTVVVIGDAVATDVQVINGKTIRFTVPPQKAPGVRTLSVWTPSGIAQMPFQIFPKKLGELADGEITTIAGGVGYVNDGKMAGDSHFSIPSFVTGDSAGNLYISDTFYHRIRRIDAKTNLVTTIVGNGRRGFDGDGSLALTASIAFPGDIVITPDRKLIFVDAGNARIRQVNLETGLITTVAGNGIEGSSGDSGPALNARFSLANAEFSVIGGIAVDSLGNLYIADTYNDRVRRVDHTTGIITAFAGTGEPNGSIGDGGPASQATLFFVLDVAVDPSGNVLIIDRGHNLLRRVDTQTGIISTIAGTGETGIGGDGLPAIQASISAGKIEVDSIGNIYLAERSYYRIRRIDAQTTIIQTIAGNGTKGEAGVPGEQLATQTGLGILYGGGIFVSASSQFVITEGQWDRIRRVDLRTGMISVLAGGKPSDNGDKGPALTAKLVFSDIVNRLGIVKPGEIAVTESGETIFLAEPARHRVRKIDLTTGFITTIAGTGISGYNGDSQPAEKAMLSEPTDVAISPGGNIMIADNRNHRIRQIEREDGLIRTVAGNGKGELNADYDEDYNEFYFLDDDGPALEAAMVDPLGIALDANGNLFLSLFGVFVRRVDAQTQLVTTPIGCCFGSGRRFLRGITVNPAGVVYVANTNQGILRLGPGETQPSAWFFGTSFFDVVTNRDGVVFGAALTENAIYQIEQAFGIKIAGGKLGYEGDNGPAREAAFSSPSAVAIDGANNLYIVDSGNNAVRVIKNGAR